MKKTVISYILANILLLISYIFIYGCTLLGAPKKYILCWLIIYVLINTGMSLFVVKSKKEYIMLCIIVPILIPIIWFLVQMLLYGY